jgi:hypothetical protein
VASLFSDSTTPAPAHPLIENKAATTFLFGSFSFERKEKEHPLTINNHSTVPNENGFILYSS